MNGMVAGALLRRSPAARGTNPPQVIWEHMLRVDARPHKLYPPTCRQVEPKRKLPFKAKIGRRVGLSEQYVRWGATETFLPAAHDHPMCYESMLRGTRWTYGPRT